MEETADQRDPKIQAAERPYVITDKDREMLDKNFVYHSPKETQPVRYGELRWRAKELAALIVMVCPPSRERSVALTELETAIFWANAAIARNE